MLVSVVYFAAARDLAALGSEKLKLPEGTRVGDLLEEVMRLHPELRKLEPSIRLSVNFEVAGKRDTLRNGDEVGVLPPVAGG